MQQNFDLFAWCFIHISKQIINGKKQNECKRFLLFRFPGQQQKKHSINWCRIPTRKIIKFPSTKNVWCESRRGIIEFNRATINKSKCNCSEYYCGRDDSHQ